jgi:hypothetical protein
MSDTDTRLDRLGKALHGAALVDLGSDPEYSRIRRRVGPSTQAKVGIALLAAALAVPAVGLAGKVLTADEKVAESLPHGSPDLIGTDPACTVIRAGVEYDCVLANPPHELPDGPGPSGAPGEFQGAPGEWLGVVEVTNDDSHHVNGGCRSENAEGTRWRCFLGEEAVRQKVIAENFLGDSLPYPGAG